MPSPVQPPLPEHVVARRTGHEHFAVDGTALSSTLSDFWTWSASDLLSNALRGQLAEYIVGLALDCVDGKLRREWDAFDLMTRDNIAVEVKSTAYLQTLGTTKASSRRFDIRATTGWHADSNSYSTIRQRQADVYVFCVHTSTDRRVADPLRLDQWDFYVVATTTINKALPQQRSIALSQLTPRLGAHAVGFGEVRDAVRAAVAGR